MYVVRVHYSVFHRSSSGLRESNWPYRFVGDVVRSALGMEPGSWDIRVHPEKQTEKLGELIVFNAIQSFSSGGKEGNRYAGEQQ